MQFVQKLNNPYYLEESLLKRISISFLFGLFIFLFLFLFQPFGLNQVPELPELALGYGLCCFLVMLVLYAFLPLLLPAVFNEEKWTIRREMIWVLLIVGSIGVANGFYSIYAGISPPGAKTFLVYGIYTLLIGLFPVSISVVLNERKQAAKFRTASAEINSQIKESPVASTSQDDDILIPSENKNEELKLKGSDLLFIRSADNYAEVYFIEKGQVQKKLLRSSLKSISQAFETNPSFFRCHKSYLVNLQKVKQVSGNAQGYKLQLNETDNAIPVSRSLNSELRSRLGL